MKLVLYTSRYILWDDGILADMPSCLGGGGSSTIHVFDVANCSVEVRLLLLQHFFSCFIHCGVMELWQTCPLVSGVGIRDKRSVMPPGLRFGRLGLTTTELRYS